MGTRCFRDPAKAERARAALLTAGALYEMETGLAGRVPIEPRPGEVPPVEIAPAPEAAPAKPRSS